MLLKLHFFEKYNRFNSRSLDFGPVVLLCLAFVLLSPTLSAGSDYRFVIDQPKILPGLTQTLSEDGKKKAHALADYAFACKLFKDQYALSKKAIRYFVSAVKNDPVAETPLHILATYWKRNNKVDALLENLLPIAKKNPHAIKLNVLVSATLSANERCDEAIELLKNSLKIAGIDSKNGVPAELRAKLILKLVKCYLEEKDWDKGEELLDDALDILDLKDLITTRLAASIFYSNCADQGPDGFFAGWSKRRYRKKLELNLTRLEELCSEVNFDVRTLSPILDIYKRYSMNERAEKLILSQLLLKPNDSQAFILLAKVFDENKKYAAAFRVWKIIVDSPQYANVKRLWKTISKQVDGAPEIYYQLGNAAMKCENWDEAVKAYDWGLLNNPGDPRILFQLGFAYLKMRKFKKAIYKFEKVPNLPDAQYFIAYCYRQLDKTVKAFAAIEASEVLAKELKDENFLSKQFYMEYIYLADKAGEFNKSETMALAQLKKSPEDPMLNNFLGYLWADKNKNLAKAVKMIKIALGADQSNAAYLDSMAWVLYRQKKYASALSYIEDAIEASEEHLVDAVLRDHAGDINDALGKKGMALKQWRLALETYSDDIDQDKIKAKIAKIISKKK